MGSINAISANNAFGILSYAHVTIRARQKLLGPLRNDLDSTYRRPSYGTLRKVVRLREALEALKPARIRTTFSDRIWAISPGYAQAVSQTALDFGPQSTELRSTEEVNTAPTSFTAFGPNLVGSTVTAPWSGPGSTAEATVSGAYDGSNGSGTVTFRVSREGTHGQDDLKIKVFAPDGSEIEQVDIKKEDPLNKVYTLSNGLAFTLGAGDLVKNEEFTVDTTLLSTSFSPTGPAWIGSTAAPTIGGTYDGSQGTGTLTFRVDKEGTHGVDDLKLKVYAPDGSFIQNVDIKKEDAIDQVYSLDNGVTLALGGGDVIKNETFVVNVDAADPSSTNPTQPEWITSSATASIGGTYDGTNGTGTLTFRVDRGGTHGVDDLKFKIYAPDGSFLQNLDVKKEDAIDQVYTLDNGLTFTLAAGDVIKNETFTVDLEAATSFSTTPHPLESTAEVTIGGVYDGAQDTGTLSFLITAGGTHGMDDLAVEVYGPDENLIETVNVLQTDPLDQVYRLANGLTFQLASGTLVENETFTVDVNHQIGSRVDPDKQFDGTRNDNPNFDIGLSVTSGSFVVNGVSINVLSDDTLNSVLDRINQSAADVTATFDPAGETVILAHDSPGSGQSIVVENDTSGFLAATKLAGATSVNSGANENTPIAQIDSLSTVSSGSIQINGVSISLDVNTDSMEDMVSRINASAANVTADFDISTNKFSIVANQVEDLLIDSGGTGFFEAMSVNIGTHESTEGEPGSKKVAGLSMQNRRHVADVLQRVSKALNAFFDDDDLQTTIDPALEALRLGVHQGVGASFGDDVADTKIEYATNFGIKFDFDPKAKEVFRFSSHTKSRLMTKLQSFSNATAFRELMFGESQKPDGLVERLIALTKEAERDITNQLGSVGLFLDVYA